MEESCSGESNIRTVSQQIPFLLWNLKVHYLTHKNPTTVTNYAPVSSDLTHTAFLVMLF